MLKTCLVMLAGGLLAANWALADDWPQWLGPQRDAVWRETGILRTFPATGPAYLWRAPVGAGYSGPAVSGGRVLIMDRKADPGDKTAGTERVLCLEEATGKVLWQRVYGSRYTMSYNSGPRATPLVSEGKVFTLGAEGRLHCVQADSGQVVWVRDFKADYQAPTPMWGFAAHPLLDGNRLICLVGGPQSLVVAFDRETGKELWRALDAKEPGYCPPMIFESGGQRQLIIFHPEALNGLDPATGRLLWSEPYSAKAGLTVPMPRQQGDRLFVTTFYNGPLMLRIAGTVPKASVIWRGKSNSEVKTDGLHSIIPTPFWEGGHLYGVCSYGQLRCVNAETGERVWETLQATSGDKPVRWANAFLIKNGEVFFIPNEKGDLIIARLSPQGYQELSRTHLLEPTNRDCGRPVVWSHPAFANRKIFMRNDRELVCVSLAE